MTPPLTLYTSADCIQCTFTKKELARQDIPFNEIDITDDEPTRNYIKDTLKLMRAPVVVPDPSLPIEPFAGFQPAKITQIKQHLKH